MIIELIGDPKSRAATNIDEIVESNSTSFAQ